MKGNIRHWRPVLLVGTLALPALALRSTQWLASGSIQPPPVLFGLPMPLDNIGGEPTYLFFSYFKPDGHVLFAKYDSDSPCSR
jgi:hypothetical protein